MHNYADVFADNYEILLISNINNDEITPNNLNPF